MVTTAAIKDTAIVLDCSLEFYGKTLSLKTPCSFIIELGEIKLVVTRKLPHCWIALIVLEGAMQAAREKIFSTVLPSCEHFEQQ